MAGFTPGCRQASRGGWQRPLTRRAATRTSTCSRASRWTRGACARSNAPSCPRPWTPIVGG
eukprot:8624472-Lingulodinium_polyedra.AAC.1